MLPGQPAKHAEARRCAHVNAFFLKTILSAFDGEEGGMPPHLAGANAAGDAVAARGYRVSHAELDKVRARGRAGQRCCVSHSKLDKVPV
eukprot:366438-Chlamydomonas_euryale.AAC.23